MPVAAVPAYLGQNFKDASPGMRFGMYLPIWTERADQEQDVRKRAEAKSREGSEVADLLQRGGMDAAIQELQSRKQKPLAGLWEKNDFASKQAWKQIAMLSPRDKALADSLVSRQRLLSGYANDASILKLEALSTAPFATGLGNEHPLENGFAFLNPYGLPYLPGSGIKGVLRQAARELASGDWGEQCGWSTDKSFILAADKARIALSAIDALFGLESANGETQHVRGALTFWDVIPQIKGDSLMVDIMTPHQSHYYQQKLDPKAGDSVAPHDSGQPKPISFLTVPPGSGFTFHVQCDLAHLTRLAPELVPEGKWKTLLAAAFEHAFQWLGFGAKTAVGYGSMMRDIEAEERQRTRQAEQTAIEQRKRLSPAMRAVADFVESMARRHESLRGRPTRSNGAEHNQARQLASIAHDSAAWTSDDKRAAAQAIIEWLPKVVNVDMKDERKKLRLTALLGQP